tara:strand:- start:4421 stop:5785 length:1365 start_codon:yes stop_codon:yes gene_type:complete
MHLSINNKTGRSVVELSKHIKSLYEFSQKELGFNRPPSINLLEDIENSKDVFGKTGYYDPNNMGIYIYTTGRHPKDILRSLSHELVHHSQNCNGQFSKPEMGETSLGYAQENGHLRSMEADAYKRGSGLIFRDWEDGIKNCTNYNNSIKEIKNMSRISEQSLRKTIRSIIKSTLKETHDEPMEAVADVPGPVLKPWENLPSDVTAEEMLAAVKAYMEEKSVGRIEGVPAGHVSPDVSSWRRNPAAKAAAADAATDPSLPGEEELEEDQRAWNDLEEDEPSDNKPRKPVQHAPGASAYERIQRAAHSKKLRKQSDEAYAAGKELERKKKEGLEEETGDVVRPAASFGVDRRDKLKDERRNKKGLAESNRKRVRQEAAEALNKAAANEAAAKEAAAAKAEAAARAEARRGRAAEKRAAEEAAAAAAAAAEVSEPEGLNEWYGDGLYGRLLKEYTKK